MENEYYLLYSIEHAIKKVIEKETKNDTDFGYLANNIERRMAEAAFAVFKASYELNEFLKSENSLK